MSFDSKVLNKTRILNRLNITYDEEFTIPETAALFCAGGGFFRNGIVVGNNNSTIPGSMRSCEDKLQHRKLNKWVTLAGFSEDNCKENSIVKFGKEGELEDTNILIKENSIVGVDFLETEYIIAPNNKDINLCTTEGEIKLNSTFVDANGKMCITNNKNYENINFLSSPPENSSSSGEKGDFAWDKDYFYMCVAKNTWKRTPLESW